MIYIWNITALKSDLAGGRVSGRGAFVYLACILSVQAASWALGYTSVESFSLWDAVDAFRFFLFLIIGTVYCFYVNGGGKGRDFSIRYVSLAWVFGVQYAIIVMAPLALILYIIISLFADLADKTQWYDVLFNACLGIPFYYFLAGHIRDVALNRVPSEEELSRMRDEYDEDFDQSKYPTILRRYVSTSIDMVFILILFAVFITVLQGHNDINSGMIIRIGIVLLFFYEPVLTSRLCTIGQKITGIRIRKIDSGERLSIYRACLRTIVKLALGIVSFFSIPVTRKRRALHDFPAGSVVIFSARK